MKRKKMAKRLAAFLLAGALAFALVPQASFAAESGSSTEAVTDTVDSGTAEEDGQTEVTVTETVTTYDLDISVSTKQVSGSKKILKTVTVTKPVLTTTVTDAETGEVIS